MEATTYGNEREEVSDMVSGPDGKRYVAFEGSRVMSFSPPDCQKTQEELWPAENSTEKPKLALNSRGSTLAVTHGCYIRLFDLEHGGLNNQSLMSHLTPVQSIAFDGDGRLVSTSEDGTTMHWDADGDGSSFSSLQTYSPTCS